MWRQTGSSGCHSSRLTMTNKIFFQSYHSVTLPPPILKEFLALNVYYSTTFEQIIKYFNICLSSLVFGLADVHLSITNKIHHLKWWILYSRIIVKHCKAWIKPTSCCNPFPIAFVCLSVTQLLCFWCAYAIWRHLPPIITWFDSSKFHLNDHNFSTFGVCDAFDIVYITKSYVCVCFISI